MTDNSLTIGDLKAQTKTWTGFYGPESTTIQVTDREKDAKFTLHYKLDGVNKEWPDCSRKTKIADFKKELLSKDSAKVIKMTFLDEDETNA